MSGDTMVTQPEARISGAILEALKRLGIFSFKVHGGPTQMAGLPDILACVDGLFVGFEVKTPQKRNNVSIRQKYVKGLIEQSYGFVFVVCSAGEALARIEEVRSSVITSSDN